MEKVVNLDPRNDFKKGPHGKAWEDASASATVHAACNAALSQMQSSFPVADSQDRAAANCWRMEGARMFIGFLLNLSEPDKEPAKPLKSLDYKKGI